MIAILPTHTFTIADAVVAVYHANQGEGLIRHEHIYPHATMCNAGKCVIRKADKTVELTKDSQPICLRENEWHEIEAVENDTVFVNVFAESKT